MIRFDVLIGRRRVVPIKQGASFAVMSYAMVACEIELLRNLFSSRRRPREILLKQFADVVYRF